MTHEEKLLFIMDRFPLELSKIDPSTLPVFGKMNVQQMIEHMSDSIRVGNGKILSELVTDPERLPLVRSFMLSDKDFKPNTKNALMGEEPPAIRNASINLAIAELKNELNDFQKYFSLDENLTLMNPFFGPLNFQEWTHLFHKHAKHHLNQFNVIVE